MVRCGHSTIVAILKRFQESLALGSTCSASGLAHLQQPAANEATTQQKNATESTELYVDRLPRREGSD